MWGDCEYQTSVGIFTYKQESIGTMWLMLDDDKELLIPGREESAGVVQVLCLAAGRHKGCVPLCTSCWLLPWMLVEGN